MLNADDVLNWLRKRHNDRLVANKLDKLAKRFNKFLDELDDTRRYYVSAQGNAMPDFNNRSQRLRTELLQRASDLSRCCAEFASLTAPMRNPEAMKLIDDLREDRVKNLFFNSNQDINIRLTNLEKSVRQSQERLCPHLSLWDRLQRKQRLLYFAAMLATANQGTKLVEDIIAPNPIVQQLQEGMNVRFGRQSYKLDKNKVYVVGAMGSSELGRYVTNDPRHIPPIGHLAILFYSDGIWHIHEQVGPAHTVNVIGWEYSNRVMIVVEAESVDPKIVAKIASHESAKAVAYNPLSGETCSGHVTKILAMAGDRMHSFEINPIGSTIKDSEYKGLIEKQKQLKSVRDFVAGILKALHVQFINEYGITRGLLFVFETTYNTYAKLYTVFLSHIAPDFVNEIQSHFLGKPSDFIESGLHDNGLHVMRPGN